MISITYQSKIGRVQWLSNIDVVNRIDVVCAHHPGHNFSTTMIRLSGSQHHAARVLEGLSCDDLADRAKLCRHSIRKWETSSDAVPGAMYPHLCRVVDILEGEGARFTGDGVSTLSGDLLLSNGSGTSHHQLRTIARAYGMDLAARVRHAGVSHARHKQESQSARILEWFAARLPSDEHFHSFSAR